MAYWILKKNGFGGKERSIHTKNRPELKDKILRVLDKKVVKTGIYNYGWGYGDDYDPPYLGNEKSHIILSICITDGFFEEFRIEEKNVEKYGN